MRQKPSSSYPTSSGSAPPPQTPVTTVGGVAHGGTHGSHSTASSAVTFTPAPPISWGVFLHPSVFRIHTTARDVFYSLHRNGGLPSLPAETAPASTPSVASYLETGQAGPAASLSATDAGHGGESGVPGSGTCASQRKKGAVAAAEAAQAAAAAASPMLPPAPHLTQFPTTSSSSTATPERPAALSAASAAGQGTAHRQEKESHPRGQKPTAEHVFLAYSSNGRHPQLVSFNFRVCPAIPLLRSNEDASPSQVYAKDPAWAQLRSSRLNSLEAVVPDATDHPALDPQQLPRNPQFAALSLDASARAAMGTHAPLQHEASLHTSTEQTRQQEVAALAAQAAAGTRHTDAATPDTAAPRDTERAGVRDAYLAEQAEAVSACLYGSRRNATQSLFLYGPAPYKGCLTGSVQGQRVGCGEGTGLDGSALLSGLQIALASMEEGEEASFFIASPASFEYTAPQLKAISATMGSEPGALGRALTGTARSSSASHTSHASRSSSTSSRGYSSSSSSSSSSSEEGGSPRVGGSPGSGKKTKRSLRERFGLRQHHHHHHHHGKPNDKHKSKGKDGLTNPTPLSIASQQHHAMQGGTNSLREAAVALSLMHHGASKVLFYSLKLVQRVPLMNVMPVSTALTQCFLTLPGSGGTAVVVPRPVESTQGMLRRLSSSWVKAMAARDASWASGSHPHISLSTSVPPGAVNPLTFFVRANFSGGLLGLVEQLYTLRSASQDTSKSAASGSAGALWRRLQTEGPTGPFVATFARGDKVEWPSRSESAHATAAAAVSRTVTTPGRGSGSASVPSLSIPALGIDVEGIVQRVLGDPATVRQAQAAGYTATLFTIGAHANMREVGGSHGQYGQQANVSASSSMSALPTPGSPGSLGHVAPLTRTEGMRFETFTLLDALDECVELDKNTTLGSDGDDGEASKPPILRVAYDPTRNHNAALRFLEKDFLSFHRLSSNMNIHIEAYNPLSQGFVEVAPHAYTSHQGSPAHTVDGGPNSNYRNGMWSVTVGSVMIPCWLDLVCGGVPRHQSVASVVHLLSDCSDDIYMGRLLTEIRREAQRYLDEVARLRRCTLQQLEREGRSETATTETKAQTDNLEDSTGGAPLAPHAAPTESSTHTSAHPTPAPHALPPSSTPLSAAAALTPAEATATPTNMSVPTASSHFTTGDAAAYRQATAPSSLQRRLENTYRLILQSPSAPPNGGPAHASGGVGGGASSSDMSTLGLPSSTSSTVRKGYFYYTNAANSCAAARALLVEVCGLLAYYDANRSSGHESVAHAVMRTSEGETETATRPSGSDLPGRARAPSALVGGHHASLTLLMEDANLTEFRLSDDVRALLRSEVLSSVANAAEAALPPASESSSPAGSVMNRTGGASGGTLGAVPQPSAPSPGPRGPSRSTSLPFAPPPTPAVVAVVAAVTVAMNPSLLVRDYFLRQHGKFGRRAEKGKQPATLNALLLGNQGAGPASASRPSSSQPQPSPRATAAAETLSTRGEATVAPLAKVAASALFFPSPPMPLARRMHYIRHRLLYKVLERLYTCVFMLTFNVDESAVRPASCGDLYDNFFANDTEGGTAYASRAECNTETSPERVTEDASVGDASAQEQQLRRRRYGYLAEAYQYIALVYAEMTGMTSHALDAVAAALYYAPYGAELWVLRANLLARQRQYLRASLDLDVAAALAENRLQSLLAFHESETGAEEYAERVRACKERLALARLQQQGLSILFEDSRGNVGAGAANSTAASAGGRSSKGVVPSSLLAHTLAAGYGGNSANASPTGATLGAGTPMNASLSLNTLAAVVNGSTTHAGAATSSAAAAVASGMPGTGPAGSTLGVTPVGAGSAGASVTFLPVLGSHLLAANGAGSVLH